MSGQGHLDGLGGLHEGTIRRCNTRTLGSGLVMSTGQTIG